MASIPHPVNDVIKRVDGTLAAVDELLNRVDSTLANVETLLRELHGELALLREVPDMAAKLDEVHAIVSERATPERDSAGAGPRSS